MRRLCWHRASCPLSGPLFALAVCATATPASAAETEEGSFTEFGTQFSLGPALGRSDNVGLHGLVSLDARVFHISERRYLGYGVEANYYWGDRASIGNYLGRVELGLGRGRFNTGTSVGFITMYVGLMAGYSSGTVWDLTYVEAYGMDDEVEVSVSGIPLIATLGLRRIGALGLNFEVLGGCTIITSQEAEEIEGEAPGVVPYLGIRVGIGWDTFHYKRY